MKRFMVRPTLFFLTSLAAVSASLSVLAQSTVPVSVNNAGTVSNSLSNNPSLSYDGRFVVFLDLGSNLVPGDTNDRFDVFLRDTQTNTTTRLSVSSGGGQANDESNNPFISSSGRFVVFDSKAANLVSGDTNAKRDCFLLDRQTNILERVSLGNGSVQGDGDCRSPVVSDDGRFVAFESNASNLTAVTGNGKFQIYLRDRTLGTTVCISTGAGGVLGDGDSLVQAITSDGRFLTLSSTSSNLVANDTNGLEDAFLYDRTGAKMERVSVASNGAGGNGDSGTDGVFASLDGRYVFFGSNAGNLDPRSVEGRSLCYLRDRAAGTTTLVSLSLTGNAPDNDTYPASFTPNGQIIGFDSFASNLVANDTNNEEDAFVRNLASGKTTLISAGTDGGVGAGILPRSVLPILSGNGKQVAFRSSASNLAPGITDTNRHIYLRGPVYEVLSGTLDLLPGTAAPQDFRFTVRLAGADLYTLTRTVSPSGEFSFLVEPDAYVLHLKSDRYLGLNDLADAMLGDAALGLLPVKAGDVDGNNTINVDDLTLLLNAYNTTSASPQYAPFADFNLNGSIDVDDLTALLNSYNVTGQG